MKQLKYLVAAILLTTTTIAAGHTGLDSSIPADGAMLMESPKTVELDFTADVNLTKFEVVNKMSGAAVEVEFTPSATASSYFSVPVAELAKGHYQVNWALLGGDGHQMTGSFDFMVHGADMSMMDGSATSMPMRTHGADMPSASSSEAESSEDNESHSGH